MEESAESQGIAGRRILYGVTKSNAGGAQGYVRMLAMGARDAGAHVSVMAGSADGKKGPPGRLFTELAEAGISAIPLTAVERDVNIFSEWSALKELLKRIKEEQPEVLHLNSSKMGMLGGIAGRIAGVRRIIFTAHGWPHKEPRSPLWKMIAWIGSWLTVNLSHATICVSEDDLHHAPVLLFRDKLSVIRNGIPEFAVRTREDARAALIAKSPGLGDCSKWLVMNAELHPNKGIDIAIRALAEISHAYPGLALAVCGEGEERVALTSLSASLKISDRVHLVGFVPEARTYLLAGNIFLMPSRKEGMPLALLEAGWASLPVIASKIGGIPEVISDQETGLYMPRDNTHILAKAISYLLDNPGKANELGANLHIKVTNDFSEQKMIRSTFALYS